MAQSAMTRLVEPLSTPFLSQYRRPISSLGFSPPVDVSRIYGIGALIPNKRRRAGIYLLVLRDGLFYIGRAKDVVRRFSAHRKTFGERLIGFSYQEVAESNQPEVERQLIHRGERAGLPLRQTEWTSQRYDEADLDALFTPEELAAWGEDPVAHLVGDNWPLPLGTVGQQALDQEKFERLLAYPLSADVLRLFATYVRQCVPFPRRTAPGYWNVTCLPSTNRSSAPRLACVSAHVMETFVVGHEYGDPQNVWSFVVAAKTPLEARYGSLAKAQRALRGVEIVDDGRYKSAGFDQCQIFMDDLATADRVLALPVIQEAARQLMFHVMRKGVNRYARFHCTALAEAILRPLGK
jgi:hypothetical protein